MTEQHRATPEQWADAGAFASDTRACLLELRDRLAAAEHQISQLERLQSWVSPEMADGLDSVASRISAAEQRISELEGTANLRQQDEDAELAIEPATPAESLVEGVRRVIGDNAPCSPSNARDAILAVADWLDDNLAHKYGHGDQFASRLRKEVERHD